MSSRLEMPSWRKVCAIMGNAPKPPLWGRFVRDDPDRPAQATVVFDGFDSWYIDDGERIELSGPQGSVFVKSNGVEHIDGRPAHANSWIKSLIQPRLMSLGRSTATPVGIEKWLERPCWVFDVGGLKHDSPAVFRSWIDSESGVVLRMSRDDIVASLYAEEIRFGVRIRPITSLGSNSPPSRDTP